MHKGYFPSNGSQTVQQVKIKVVDFIQTTSKDAFGQRFVEKISIDRLDGILLHNGMILRSDRLDGMPGEAEGRWKDQEPQESQFCHLYRMIVRRRQILGLSYFGGLLWWKVAWQRPKEMPPANISFTGQSCLLQPKPDADI